MHQVSEFCPNLIKAEPITQDEQTGEPSVEAESIQEQEQSEGQENADTAAGEPTGDVADNSESAVVETTELNDNEAVDIDTPQEESSTPAEQATREERHESEADIASRSQASIATSTSSQQAQQQFEGWIIV